MNLERGVLAARSDFARVIVDAIPLPVFVVDADVRILDFNRAAQSLLTAEKGLVLRRRGGEALHCTHAQDAPGGCGAGPHCKDCVVRNAVNATLQGGAVARKQAQMELLAGDQVTPVQMLVTTAPFDYSGRRLVLLILEDISELIALRSLLPICARCRQVRDDQAYWHHLEDYLGSHLNLDLTHGLCPACAQVLFPDECDPAHATSVSPADPRGVG